MTQPGLVPVQTTHSASLRGVIRAPGDKSISHRALIIAALATGRSLIKGLLVADDLTSTANALRQCGVVIGVGKQGDCEIDGVGIGGLIEAADVLDLGNSGTAVRLLMGVLASHPIQTIFSGDRSLQARPMRRVAEPLEQMGASYRRAVAYADYISTACRVGTSKIRDSTCRPKHYWHNEGNREHSYPKSYREHA